MKIERSLYRRLRSIAKRMTGRYGSRPPEGLRELENWLWVAARRGYDMGKRDVAKKRGVTNG